MAKYTYLPIVRTVSLGIFRYIQRHVAIFSHVKACFGTYSGIIEVC